MKSNRRRTEDYAEEHLKKTVIQMFILPPSMWDFTKNLDTNTWKQEWIIGKTNQEFITKKFNYEMVNKDG